MILPSLLNSGVAVRCCLIEVGSDEKKFQQLLSKEDSSFADMKDPDLDRGIGGESWFDALALEFAQLNQ